MALVSCAAGAMCCGSTDVLAGATGDKPASLDAGPLADFAKDGTTDTWAKSHGVFVIRADDQVYAVSSTCTHKNKALKLKDGQIYCPAHGSLFSEHGTAIKGPAKSSLERYAINTDANGHVVVDLTKSFSEKQWEDPASFIALKK